MANWNDSYKDPPRHYQKVCCSCSEPFSPLEEPRSGVCTQCNRVMCQECLEGNELRLCLTCQPPEAEWEGEDPFFYPHQRMLLRHEQLANDEYNARRRLNYREKKLR